MHNRYTLLYQELIVRQQRPDGNSLQTETQRRQEGRFRSELLQTQNQNGYLRAKIQDSKNHIEELQRRLQGLREEGSSAQLRISKEIEAARRRLEHVNQDYVTVTSLKTSLEKEIHDYRDLLESKSLVFLFK
jgi:predicted RNase H-like nuclease (RuvC/YqgF family)